MTTVSEGRTVSIRRIAAPAGASVGGSPASLRALGIAPSAPALDLAATTAMPASPATAPVVASKRNHSHKPSREPRDNMFAMAADSEAAVAAAAASSSPATAASSGGGLDSKRTVRKKVAMIGLQPQQPLAVVSTEAGIASVTDHSSGTSSLRSSPRPKLAAGPAIASISERMRVRGSALAPLANHNLGTPASSSPAFAPLGKSSPRGGGAQVGDLADASQPASPLFATPTEKDREGSKLHLSRNVADGGSGDNGSDDEDSEFSRRFARGAGVTPAVRGAKLDADGCGLDPAYYELVRLNPLFWTDPDFASNADQIWMHYTTHLRAAFQHKERRDQHLDHASLTRLANDTVERFLERHRALIAKTNPRFSQREVHAAVIKDLPHTSMALGASFASLKTKQKPKPKKASSASAAATADESTAAAQPFEGASLIAELKTHVSYRLRKELDKDRDGRISHTDFLMRWKPTVTRLMYVEKQNKELCVIL